MKKIKLLFLVVGLFIQGCSNEVPLFKDHEDLKSDEAVVVYSIYVTDPLARGGLFSGYQKLNNYTSSLWIGENETLNFQAENHISSGVLGQKYIIAKIKPGRYIFKGFKAEHEGREVYQRISMPIEINCLNYNKSNYPFEFTINPGEVKYLGDIEIQTVMITSDRFIMAYLIHNRYKDAKQVVNAKHQSLSSKLLSDILKKTPAQLLEESKSSFEDKPVNQSE